MDINKCILLINSLVLTGLTFFLVKFTRLLWIETKRLRLRDTTPQISIYFYPESPIVIGFRVENTSDVDARNVDVVCMNNNLYEDDDGRKFKYSEQLSRYISYFPARQNYSFLLGYYSEMKNEIFEFNISFESVLDNEKIHRKIFVNMSLLEGMAYEKNPQIKIATTLENIQQGFASVIEKDVFSGVRVYPHSEAERQIKKYQRTH